MLLIALRKFRGMPSNFEILLSALELLKLSSPTLSFWNSISCPPPFEILFSFFFLFVFLFPAFFTDSFLASCPCFSLDLFFCCPWNKTWCNIRLLLFLCLSFFVCFFLFPSRPLVSFQTLIIFCCHLHSLLSVVVRHLHLCPSLLFPPHSATVGYNSANRRRHSSIVRPPLDRCWPLSGQSLPLFGPVIVLQSPLFSHHLSLFCLANIQLLLGHSYLAFGWVLCGQSLPLGHRSWARPAAATVRPSLHPTTPTSPSDCRHSGRCSAAAVAAIFRPSVGWPFRPPLRRVWSRRWWWWWWWWKNHLPFSRFGLLAIDSLISSPDQIRKP